MVLKPKFYLQEDDFSMPNKNNFLESSLIYSINIYDLQKSLLDQLKGQFPSVKEIESTRDEYDLLLTLIFEEGTTKEQVLDVLEQFTLEKREQIDLNKCVYQEVQYPQVTMEYETYRGYFERMTGIGFERNELCADDMVYFFPEHVDGYSSKYVAIVNSSEDTLKVIQEELEIETLEETLQSETLWLHDSGIELELLSGLRTINN